MDNSVVVSLRDIVVEFDGQRILDGLNLDIHDKEFVMSLIHISMCIRDSSVAYIARVDDFDCGIMISASHNPYYDNGIKLIDCYRCV